MKMTLDIDPQVLQAAETRARETGEDIGSIISAWAQSGLSPAPGILKKGNCYVFDVPADTQVNAEIVKELIADEGVDDTPAGR